MKARTRCPACGAILRMKRFGIEMSPLKAQLLDLVKAAGNQGIESQALLDRLPIEGALRQRTLNVHINQLNEAITDTPWRIIGYSGTKFFVRKRGKALPQGLKSALTQ